MQITLDDAQYERLRQEAERTGASLAELIRRALNEKYRAELTIDEKLRIVEETAGALGEGWGQRMDEQERARRERAAQRVRDR
jgi:hypothetical protein